MLYQRQTDRPKDIHTEAQSDKHTYSHTDGHRLTRDRQTESIVARIEISWSHKY